MLKALRPYFKLTHMMIQDILVYRAEFVSRFITFGARFAVSAYLWVAILNASGGDIAGYNSQSILTYFLLISIVGGFTFSSSGFIAGSDIRTGELSKYLVLPISYIGRQVSTNLGRNLFYFTCNSLIYIGLGLLFSGVFDFNFPLAHYPAAFYTLLLGFILNFCFVMATGMLAFWITSSNRLIYIYYAVITLLSGTIVPIEMFPEWAQRILNVSPFPYLFYFPVKILQSSEWTVQLTQGIWIGTGYASLAIVLMLAVYRLGIRSYEAVGN